MPRSNCFCRSACSTLTRGSSFRSIGALLVFEQIVSGHAAGSLVTFVPDEPVKPGFRLDLFLWFLVIGIPRLLNWLDLVAGIFANYRASGIEDLDSCFAFGSILQIVVDNRARWRVLAGYHRFALFV